MAVLEVVTFPHPILKQKCAEVTRFDAELHQFLDDMAETMNDADGIGLAANQVGQPVRVFLMDVPTNRGSGEKDVKTTGRIEVINPKIIGKRGELKYEEGCLSFPGMSEFVTRAAEIDLAYQDRSGAEVKLTAKGLVAVCIQHELDHLDGITFIDRLSPFKRKIALREYLRKNREAIDDQALREKLKTRRAQQNVG